MGKRPAGVELFEGNMVSMQRELVPHQGLGPVRLTDRVSVVDTRSDAAV